MNEVNKINKLLKTTNLKIIRAGEFTDDFMYDASKTC